MNRISVRLNDAGFIWPPRWGRFFVVGRDASRRLRVGRSFMACMSAVRLKGSWAASYTGGLHLRAQPRYVTDSPCTRSLAGNRLDGCDPPLLRRTAAGSDGFLRLRSGQVAGGS